MTEFETESGQEAAHHIEEVVRGFGQIAVSRLRYGLAIFDYELGWPITAEQQALIKHGPLTSYDISSEQN